MSNAPRLNWNVPRALVRDVENIAASQGLEVSWWLKRVVTQAVKDSLTNGYSIDTIDINKLEAFRNE